MKVILNLKPTSHYIISVLNDYHGSKIVDSTQSGGLKIKFEKKIANLLGLKTKFNAHKKYNASDSLN